MPVRLQKFLSEAGVASRRASEEIIAAGRVSINGRTVRELGTKVDPAHDRVAVDGDLVKARRKLYVALNKPAGYVCSRRDPLQRSTVYALLPTEWHDLLHTVGRLDLESEGLIFLTNDGDFSLRITHPRYQIRKKYLATVQGRLAPDLIRRLTQGVVHQDERLKADRARVVRGSSHQTLVELELTEGKYREVRRLFEVLGYEVIQLKRIQIGPIKLGELPAGKWRTLNEREVRALAGI